MMDVMNLNMLLLEERQLGKARSKMNRMTTGKIVTIVLGIAWALLLGVLAVAGSVVNLYFAISMAAICMLNLVAVSIYIQQVVMILRINYGKGIVETQQKLAKLQLSTLTIPRILFLQLPFWTTFTWQQSPVFFSQWQFWLIYFPLLLMFTYAAVWLFINIRITNKSKKWFGLLFRGPAWDPIMEAQEFLEEMEAFKKE